MLRWVELHLLKKGGYHAEKRWLGLKYKYALYAFIWVFSMDLSSQSIWVLIWFEFSIDLSSQLIWVLHWFEFLLIWVLSWFEFFDWFELSIDLSSRLIWVLNWFEFSIDLSFQLILIPTNLSFQLISVLWLIWVLNWFEFSLIKQSPTFIGWSTSQFLLLCCEQTIRYEPTQTIKSDRREGGRATRRWNLGHTIEKWVISNVAKNFISSKRY